MAPMKINSVNNFYFDTQMRRIYADRIEKLPVAREEIFSVKSRLKGAYLYERELLTDLFDRGKMPQGTYLKRMREVSDQYIKRLQQNGVNIN